MYTKGKYLNKTEKEISENIKKQGFNPQKFTDEPNDIYEPHQHEETKILVFLEGEMVVQIANKEYVCQKGDELVVPSNTIHSAKVGVGGCTYFWSEKII